ncbi:MAG: RagB/SusD family nutrient uptake outer membrane protein [Bacteroidales bacterium]|nr:RagB/SusD family nutrient uptake outer membrane protein [Bacteroidales bacterium]
MKKTVILLSVIAAALAAVSCKDFLTKTPQASLSPDTYFTSGAELDRWANKFYSDIVPSADDLAELNADDNGSTTSLSAIQKGTRTPSSKSWSADTWKPLRNINYMLENNRCTDQSVKDRYDGVCYFFRAWFYFKMVRQYGDIPWYDHVIDSGNKEDLNKPRDPRGYVMLKVMEDLDRAYELLPTKWPEKPVYHVSKDAVLALKSRAALFEGTFRKYHAGSEFVPVDEQTFGDVTVSSEWFLRQAVDAAGRMLGTRTLYTGNDLRLAKKATDASYREYFVLEDAEIDETILSRLYNVDILVRHSVQYYYKANHRSASHAMVAHYLKKDGSPVQSESLSFYEVFQNRDPRLAQSIQGPGFVMVDFNEDGKTHPSQPISFDRTFNGYRIIKFISDSGHETSTTSTTDFPVFRYPEVLLNYAEAKAELGELTADDITKTIDVIRARVGMPAMGGVPTNSDSFLEGYYPKASGAQKAAILEIRRERTVELFCEGFRQWDLLRWGEGAKLTPKATGGFKGIYVNGLGEYDLDRDGKVDLCLYRGSKPTTTAPATNIIEVGDQWTITGGSGDVGYLTYYSKEDYEWQEGRDYLWPIPADQRSLTGGALTQNPGWDDGLSYEDE